MSCSRSQKQISKKFFHIDVHLTMIKLVQVLFKWLFFQISHIPTFSAFDSIFNQFLSNPVRYTINAYSNPCAFIRHCYWNQIAKHLFNTTIRVRVNTNYFPQFYLWYIFWASIRSFAHSFVVWACHVLLITFTPWKCGRMLEPHFIQRYNCSEPGVS